MLAVVHSLGVCVNMEVVDGVDVVVLYCCTRSKVGMVECRVSQGTGVQAPGRGRSRRSADTRKISCYAMAY